MSEELLKAWGMDEITEDEGPHQIHGTRIWNGKEDGTYRGERENVAKKGGDHFKKAGCSAQ